MLAYHLIRAGPQMSNRFDLLSSKTVRRHLRAFAQERRWIKAAASRIIQNAIHDSIKIVARCVDRVAEKCVLRSENSAAGIVKHLPDDPQIATNMMMRVVSNRITGNDTVVIVREALRFHQCLSSTG